MQPELSCTEYLGCIVRASHRGASMGELYHYYQVKSIECKYSYNLAPIDDDRTIICSITDRDLLAGAFNCRHRRIGFEMLRYPDTSAITLLICILTYIQDWPANIQKRKKRRVSASSCFGYRFGVLFASRRPSCP